MRSIYAKSIEDQVAETVDLLRGFDSVEDLHQT
jgi:hypothetical protein